MVRPRGGVTHLEWTGQFDGRDYPVQGVEEFVTYAYQRIDDRTYDVITKLDGRPAATSRAVLSADGSRSPRPPPAATAAAWTSPPSPSTSGRAP